jgi:hypothetical protein
MKQPRFRFYFDGDDDMLRLSKRVTDTVDEIKGAGFLVSYYNSEVYPNDAGPPYRAIEAIFIREDTNDPPSPPDDQSPDPKESKFFERLGQEIEWGNL